MMLEMFSRTKRTMQISLSKFRRDSVFPAKELRKLQLML